MIKQPVSLLEWAYDQIKDQIISGKMEPGGKDCGQYGSG